MRIVSAIDLPLKDEHVIEVDPPLRPELPGEWRRRINPFTGRSLSDKALTAEQAYRGGIQRLRGQSLTAGAVFGLDLQLEPGAAAAAPADARFQLLPGMGLSIWGEDVVVSTPRRLALGDLPVYARADHLDALLSGAAHLPPDPGAPAQPAPDAIAGGLRARLRPELPRRIGPTLGELLAKPAAGDLPRVAILVAEPVTATILGRPDATNCPHDPRDDPYDDLQLIDGCRLTLVFWPSEMVAITGSIDYSLPEPGPDFRNRLAYRVFDAERHALPGEAHPWESQGVPLALIGLNPDWTLGFIDRGAVSRLGGQPRPRTPLARASGQGLLWQARLSQFVEHYAELPDQSPAALAATFRELPPIGFLPTSVINLDTRRQIFFPPGFQISAAPIPIEHVDAAVRDSASLIPISLDAADEVELLVPVPERVYEPGLLEVATVDPVFSQAVARYTGDRTIWLVRREMVRRRRDLIIDGVTGCRPSWPASDLPLGETIPYPNDRAPVTCTRVRSVAAGAAAQSHRFIGAGSSLDISPGDRVYVWARIADATSLTGLMLRLGTGTAADGSGDFTHQVFWGAPANLALPAGPAAGPLRQGDLPPAGVWTRLETLAAGAWTGAGGPLTGVKVDAAEFWQVGGTVEWGPFGKVSAAGAETVLVGDDAPQDSTLQGPGGGAGWTFSATGVTDPPVEDMFGTVETAGVATIAAMTDFRAKWSQPFLAPHFAKLDEEGLDGFIADLQARVNATNDTLDLGFVRARSDIYRVRSYVLGADAASRLVTSPSLADIALRDEGARAKSADLAQFLRTAYQTDFTRDPNQPLETHPARSAAAIAASPPPPPPPPPSLRTFRPALFNTGLTLSMARQLSFTAAPTVSAARFVTPTFAATAPVTHFAAAPVAAGGAAITSTVAPARIAAPIAARTFTAFSVTAVQAVRAPIIGVMDVQGQLALPGRVERTASVAERLAPAPAVEAHAYALEGKQTVLATLAGLIGQPPPGQTRPPGLALGDLPAPGYNYRPAGDPAPPRVKNTIGDVIQDQQKVESAREYDDLDDLTPQAARHEADYFNAAVRAIDNTIALMRLVEARVDLYQQLIVDASQLRTDLLSGVTTVDARLRAINVQVEEARHDVATTSALLAEEVQRVDDLNARRARILQDNVKMILFRRPRRADIGRLIQTSPAPSALVESALTACLKEHPETPEEIRSFVSLFRDAPAAWFPAVAQQFVLIDRLDAVRTLIAAIQVRAATPMIAPPAPPAATPTKLLGAVWAAMDAQRFILDARRARALEMDVSLAATAALAQGRQIVNDHASLGDLIAGDHSRPALTAAAVRELQELGQVAGCLYVAFGETAPVIRLAWAEVLSEFAQPAPLAQLSGLPRWGELTADLKRRQQSLVDWLFSRIDRSVPNAEGAINDLVRVCLLMSAHAPVDRIIPAQLVAPARAQLGTRFDLAVDVGVTRIGMMATVRDEAGQPLAHAIVEDLADGLARARVVKTFNPSAGIAAGVRVELAQGAEAQLTAVAVSRLRVASRLDLAARTRHRVEDALRVAPAAPERLLIVRRLALGRIAAGARAERWHARAAEALADQAARAVHGGAPNAAEAGAVWFRSSAEARALLLRELAAGRRPTAWFWRLAAPGWDGAPLTVWLPRQIAAAEADVETAVALARAVVEAAEAGGLPVILAALPTAAQVHTAAMTSVPTQASDASASTLPVADAAAERKLAASLARRALLSLPPRARIAIRAAVEAHRRRPDVTAWLARSVILAAAPEAAASPAAISAAVAAVIAQVSPQVAARLTPPAPPAKRSPARLAESARTDPRPATRSPQAPSVERATARPEEAPGAPPSLTAAVDHGDRVAATETAETASSYAGNLLLIRPLHRLGLAEWLDRRPQALVEGFGRRLLAAVAVRMGAADDDAVLEVLAADRESGWADEITAWRVGLDRWLRRTARVRLTDVVRRRGGVLLDGERLDVRFALASADIRLRRHALDLDPNWTPWLGLSVRYHFRDQPLQ